MQSEEWNPSKVCPYAPLTRQTEEDPERISVHKIGNFEKKLFSCKCNLVQAMLNVSFHIEMREWH